jgi:hypothetical protein
MKDLPAFSACFIKNPALIKGFMNFGGKDKNGYPEEYPFLLPVCFRRENSYF